jgi:hypothetical protein
VGQEPHDESGRDKWLQQLAWPSRLQLVGTQCLRYSLGADRTWQLGSIDPELLAELGSSRSCSPSRESSDLRRWADDQDDNVMTNDKSEDRLCCKTKDWAEVRLFLVIRGHDVADAMGISEETLEKICRNDIGDLSGQFLRECSLWIAGYKHTQLMKDLREMEDVMRESRSPFN